MENKVKCLISEHAPCSVQKLKFELQGTGSSSSDEDGTVESPGMKGTKEQGQSTRDHGLESNV